MESNVLSSMNGVEIYGIISICLFFAVFSAMMIWSLRLKRPFLKAMSSLPLQDESDPESNT